MAEKEKEEDITEEMSEEEQIGFHKGCLSTLSKEKQELSKIVNIVDQLIQMHTGELKDLGVDIERGGAELKGEEEKSSKDKGKKKPIEDII